VEHILPSHVEASEHASVGLTWDANSRPLWVLHRIRGTPIFTIANTAITLSQRRTQVPQHPPQHVNFEVLRTTSPRYWWHSEAASWRSRFFASSQRKERDGCCCSTSPICPQMLKQVRQHGHGLWLLRGSDRNSLATRQ
jgi:hypothetical protein